MIGNDFFRRKVLEPFSRDQDQERGKLVAKVWSETPWMASVFVGDSDSGRRYEIRKALTEKLGEEAFILAGKPGRWQLGLVTMFGWNWIGFSQESELSEFLGEFGKGEP